MASPKVENFSFGRDLSGITIGRFAVRDRIGAGGMGEVYLAEDTTLKRPVALKRVGPHLRNDWSNVQRLLKEAERASALNHPGVASIYDVIQERGEVLLVMEYIEGISLRQRLREGRLEIAQVIDLAIRVCDALQAAHDKSIIHGDIKPENMMLTPNGSLKLLDFGVARRMAGDEETMDDVSHLIKEHPGGTPAYMAPEVLREMEPDGRADLFSLGIVLYEMLSGRHPFYAETPTGRTEKILQLDPPPIRKLNPAVPIAVEKIVFRLLEKDREDRYQTGNEVIEDLRDAQQGRAVWPRAMGRKVRGFGRSEEGNWVLAAALVLA